MKAVTAVVVM